MGTTMDHDKPKALAAELAKDIKSEKDLGALTQKLVKLTVETALNAELDEHLGYEKHDPAGNNTGNSRNGSTTKRLKDQHGEFTLHYGAVTVKLPASNAQTIVLISGSTIVRWRT